MAQSLDAANYATWVNCTAAWDSGGNLLGWTAGEHYNTAGTAAAWTIGVTSVSGIGHINGTGDNSGNAVYWNCVVQALSAPETF
jgi:hypothetical protein